MRIVRIRHGYEDVKTAISQAVETLRSGGVAIFPTDTVYGIGADYNNVEAISKLYEVKKRDHSKPIPLLVSSLKQVEKLADSIPHGFKRLADRFWPGGLTMVLKVKREKVPDILRAGGETVGFRMPDHDLVLGMIDSLGHPVATTSANPSGKPEISSFEMLPSDLLEKVELVIDGGRCRGGKPSTVIDLTVDPPKLLREGIIPAETITESLEFQPEVESQSKPFTVLFACTGNICRSAMAEWMLKEKLRQKEIEDKVRVISAGTLALFGSEPSGNAKKVMQEIGIDISKHRSRQISRWLLRQADLVLVMARHHKSSIKLVLPQVEDKLFLLSEFVGEGVKDVDDPYGKSIEEYRRCRDEIEKYLDLLVERLADLVEEKAK